MTVNTPITLPSLDDIVFEGRNKAYGAYALRQLYGRHLLRAVTLAVALTAVLIAVPIATSYWWPPVVVAAPIVPDGPIFEVMPPPTIAQPPVTKPPVSQATITLRTELSQDLPPTIVEDTKVQKPEQPAIAAPAVDGPVALGNINRDGTGGFADKAGPDAPGNDTAANTAAPAVIKPFVSVEVMPEFAGGQAALAKYLQRNLHYPTQALKAAVGGRVFIAFTVNTDGSITDVEVLKGLGYGTDEEASRVIRQMPAWKPGYQNNRAVPVRYNLPITFTYQ
ncbi:energy transducer TonB [Hymenobacter actinosclerus]|uniref:Outer membrane transport energization protein TonB n=1 Tax=Hymenobacter actinosclerus TaxID=82805 RepID=A0A1I0ICZ0_9BACT|nr:energy transducer TonB [Hymenobacter actinosclerus]SET94012.1 outer membrane transport energization protein TonB [Hymenobacter actinosclerus]